MSDQTPWILIAKYLAGECSHEERAELEVWMEESENYEIFRQAEESWRGQSPFPQRKRHDPEQGVRLLRQKLAESQWAEAEEESRRSSFSLYKWGIAAGIAAILAVGIFWTNKYEDQEQARIAYSAPLQYLEKTSKAGEVVQLLLPDGSRIWLNEESSIRYPQAFDGDTRQVFLKGEAFFEVVPNKEKPFIIKSRGIITKVLGTSFNVKAYENQQQTVVSVATGKVAVGTDKDGELNEITELTPEQELVVDNASGESHVNLITLAQIASWREPQLVFRNNTYEEVILALEKRYRVNIHLEKQTLKKCRLMATFKHQTSLKEILHLLSMSNSFTYEIKGSRVDIYGGECHH